MHSDLVPDLYRTYGHETCRLCTRPFINSNSANCMRIGPTVRTQCQLSHPLFLETLSAHVYKKKTKRNGSNCIPNWCRPCIWATAMRLGGFVANPIAIPTVPIASESDLRFEHSANCRTRFRLETSSANVYKKKQKRSEIGLIQFRLGAGPVFGLRP